MMFGVLFKWKYPEQVFGSDIKRRRRHRIPIAMIIFCKFDIKVALVT